MATNERSDRSTRRAPLRVAAAAVGVLLALALAGCGTTATPNPAVSAPGAATPASSAGNPAALRDPCILLTPAEVGAAAGYPVAPGRLNATGDACRWASQTGFGVQLAISRGGSDIFKAQATIYRGTKPLSGIGDEAAESSGINAVVFRKGDIVVVIDAAEATSGAAAVLAKLVAPKL